MTVSELIEALKEMPRDLDVWYSTMYDSDEVKDVVKVESKDVYGAGAGREIVHLTYGW